MRKKLLACLITAAASIGAGGVLADDSGDAVADATPSTEFEVIAEAVGAGADESATIHVYLPPEDSADGSTPVLVVDPAPVDSGNSEELPTYDVVDEGSVSEHVDPVVDQEPVALEGPADEEVLVGEEKPTVEEEVVEEESSAIDEESLVADEEPVAEDETAVGEEEVVSEEKPIALEGGEAPVEGGDTAEVGTTSVGGSEGDGEPPVMYTTTGIPTRGPEGCMECRTLTGMPENLGPEAPAPEVTADVIDDNATPGQSRAKRKSASN